MAEPNKDGEDPQLLEPLLRAPEPPNAVPKPANIVRQPLHSLDYLTDLIECRHILDPTCFICEVLEAIREVLVTVRDAKNGLGDCLGVGLWQVCHFLNVKNS